MLRLGILFLGRSLWLVALASQLDYDRIVVFGACAGYGAAAFYILPMLTFGVGAVLTVLGAIQWGIRKLRQSL
jgi:hypothetical protein